MFVASILPKFIMHAEGTPRIVIFQWCPSLYFRILNTLEPLSGLVRTLVALWHRCVVTTLSCHSGLENSGKENKWLLVGNT